MKKKLKIEPNSTENIINDISEHLFMKHQQNRNYNGCNVNTLNNSKYCSNDIESLFEWEYIIKGKYFSIKNAIKYYKELTEINDDIYGMDIDCESPYLYENYHYNYKKWDKNYLFYKFFKYWGYFNEREIRHRCSMYCYIKSQRRSNDKNIWSIFNLNNLTHDMFLIELKLLCIHLWIIKTRFLKFRSPISHKLR